jgi:hydroxypyruvate reductase 1
LSSIKWEVINRHEARRVIVTRSLPGTRWVDILTRARCRIEICTEDRVLTSDEIGSAIGSSCDGVIGQLTEVWNEHLFSLLGAAGCRVYSNYAVGYDNVDAGAATRHGIAVGNTPGVLTDTTAEMAVALTLAAARRIAEADRFVHAGMFDGWSPTLLLGKLLRRKTVGVVGCGRIGSAYARIMVAGFLMNLIYYDVRENSEIENYVTEYGKFLVRNDVRPVAFTRAGSVDEVLRMSDVVSLHASLGRDNCRMIGRKELAIMKMDAILVNTSRGQVIDEKALTEHCRTHPEFRAGLDVYEEEPRLACGLASLDNVTVVPHIGSATRWTREGMATLAALNVAAILENHPVWQDTEDILPFLSEDPPDAAPSIVNAEKLELFRYKKQTSSLGS